LLENLLKKSLESVENWKDIFLSFRGKGFWVMGGKGLLPVSVDSVDWERVFWVVFGEISFGFEATFS
jgi:hypothetical protein